MHRLWAKLSPFWCFQFYRWVDHSAVPSTILWSWFGITDRHHLWYHVKILFPVNCILIRQNDLFTKCLMAFSFIGRTPLRKNPLWFTATFLGGPTPLLLCFRALEHGEKSEKRKSLIERRTTLRNFLLENTILGTSYATLETLSRFAHVRWLCKITESLDQVRVFDLCLLE